MASFLNATEKAAISAEFDNLHDTFKRDIYVYVNEAQASEVPSSDDFNPLYGRSTDQSKTTTSYKLKKYTYSARVYYENYQKEHRDEFSPDAGLPNSIGKARLKISKEGSDKMRIADKIEVDGVIWDIDGDPKPIGPFDINYYMVYLKREN